MYEERLTVKEVAVLTGLSEHTLRYYEREGLLDRIDRVRGGHRRYSGRDLAWIEFLMRLRATGMPIRGMKRFADLRRSGDATVPARRTLLEEHRSGVRRRVSELERNLGVIDEKIEHYAEMEAKNDATRGPDGKAPGADSLRAGSGKARRGRR